MSNQDFGIPEVTCAGCSRTFPEKSLHRKETLHCPHCSWMYEFSDDVMKHAINAEAKAALDVAAINTWLDNHQKATGMIFHERHSKPEFKRAYWSIESDKKPWKFEVEYRTDQVSETVIALRLVSKSDADATTARTFSETIKAGAGKHGLDPYDVSFSQPALDETTGERSESRCVVWGVSQYISLESICEDLFNPVLDRLAKAMEHIAAQGVR